MKSRITVTGAFVITLAAAVALGAPGLAKADTVTDWNRTLIAGLEAAKLPPPPSMRIGAIVQSSVFDAVNGIERRYTPYHVEPAAPRGCLTRRRGRKRRLHGARGADPVPEAAVRPAARGDTGADLRQSLPPGTVGAARARLGEEGRERHPRLAGDRRLQRRAAALRPAVRHRVTGNRRRRCSGRRSSASSRT